MATASPFSPTDPLRSERLLKRIHGLELSREISPERLERMLEVAQRRLTSVTVLMENVYDNHNVSAVIRSAEGLGLSKVHVVDQPRRFRRNASILRGADRWLTLERHDKTTKAVEQLKAGGFVVCAADVGPGCIALQELPMDRPVAIALGSEKDGLSVEARDSCDIRFSIPMSGFTGSFNVSVSAAVTLWHVTQHRRSLLRKSGELTDDEVVTLIDHWLERSTTIGKRSTPSEAGPIRPRRPPQDSSPS